MRVRVEGRPEVFQFPDDTPREQLAQHIRNKLFPRQETSALDTAARVGATAGYFAPGMGIADALGIYPTGEGTRHPSIGQNLMQGNFADAGYQALGALGDFAYAAGPMGVGIGMAAKGGRAGRMATQGARGLSEQVTRAVDDVVAGRATHEDLMRVATSSSVPQGAPLAWRKAEYDSAYGALLSRVVERNQALSEAARARGVHHVFGRDTDLPAAMRNDPEMVALHRDYNASSRALDELQDTVGREIRRIEALPNRLNEARSRSIQHQVMAELYGSEATRMKGVLERVQNTRGPRRLEEVVFEPSFVTSSLLGDAPMTSPAQLRAGIEKLEKLSGEYRSFEAMDSRQIQEIEELIRNSPYRQ